MITALEKTKLSARAWGTTWTAEEEEEDEKEAKAGETQETEHKGTGIGAAFAVLYANNTTTATVGNEVTITGANIAILAQKVEVSPNLEEDFSLDINGQIIAGTSSSM